MKRKSTESIVMIVLFIIVLVLPNFFINLKEGKISKNENRYLASFPKLINEEGEIQYNGIRNSISTWYNDNIGFRELLVKLYANVNVKLFNRSTSEYVLKGREDWYYFIPDYSLNIYDGTYPITNELLEKILSRFQKLKDFYNSQGIEFAVVTTPSKVSVYPEFIIRDNYNLVSPADVVEEYIKNNSDIEFINLKPLLLAGKEVEQVFYKSDTHWNEIGAYYAYAGLIKRLNQIGWIQSAPVEITRGTTELKGGLWGMMGDLDLYKPEKAISTKIVNPKAQKTDRNDIGEIKVTFAYKNDDLKSGNKVLMYGDSMFGGWNMPDLLAENFTEFSYIWSYDVNKDVIAELKPDIVLYEFTERITHVIGEKNDTLE